MQIHELNNFTGTLGSGAYLAIDDGTDTGKISSQGLLAATEARIDNIIAGPAPSAEEIVDARLGADGVTYPSLGDAIRDQFTDVKSAFTNWNLNQHVEVQPFVESTESTSVGHIINNRSTLQILQSGGVKVSRSTNAPTNASFGLWFRPIPSGTSLNGHKILFIIDGLDCSGVTTTLSKFSLQAGSDTLDDIPATDLGTSLHYENIFTLPNDGATFTLLLRTTSAASANEYFTINYLQFIDLTEMFGAGNEPTLSVFKKYYSSFPYLFRISSTHVGLGTTKLLIDENKPPFDVVNTVSELEQTEKDYILVLHSTARYSDGVLWYYAREGETGLDGGYSRLIGDAVYPMPNQGTLTKTNPPIQKILDVIKSYVGRTDLVYGTDNGLYDETCINTIDCSSFVTAVLYGTKYGMSRYVLGTNELNILGEHVGGELLTTQYNQWSRLRTRGMASYFACNKRLFTLPNTAFKACNMLQFGDLIFSRDELHDDSYFGIGHVAVVIGTIPQYSTVIVAQAGGSMSAYTARSNESTVVKTTQITLNNTALENHYFVFARPDYSQDYTGELSVLSSLDITQANIKINSVNTFFQLDTIIDNVTGRISISTGDYASSIDFIKVKPSSTVTYTGNNSNSSGQAYVKNVSQYDGNKNFITRSDLASPVVLGNTTKYVRFTFGHGQAQNVRLSLNDLEDFEATITN